MRKGWKIAIWVVGLVAALYVYPFYAPLPVRTTEAIMPPFPAEYGEAAIADLEAAETLYWEGEDQAAYDLWEPLAEAGNPEAQFRMGLFLFSDHDDTSDREKGLDWFRKAAKQHHALSQHIVTAVMVRDGVDYCEEEVLRLVESSAQNGARRAQLNLGNIYFRDLCNTLDLKKGLRYLLLSASQGLPEAARRLFLIFSDEEGEFYDLKKAYFYFLISSEKKNYLWPFYYILMERNLGKYDHKYVEENYLKWRPSYLVRTP
jgi:hypothetical protein